MKQNPAAGVHTFCDRQKPLPDGAAQYYVAGKIISGWCPIQEMVLVHSAKFGGGRGVSLLW